MTLPPGEKRRYIMMYLKHDTIVTGADIKAAITGRFIRMINSEGSKILVKFDKFSNIDKVNDKCTYRVSFVGTFPHLTEENTAINRIYRDSESVLKNIFGDFYDDIKKSRK